jgi:uncharacterized membrane protein YbaN (DUF454 family)
VKAVVSEFFENQLSFIVLIPRGDRGRNTMISPIEATKTSPPGDGSDDKIAKGLKRHLFIALGSILVALGAIGIVLPVIPTTPFILLASACFARSSKKFYTWLHKSPRFKNFFDKKGLTMRGKVKILALAWLVLVLGAVFTPIDWVRILLVSIGAIKTVVFLFLIKTVPGQLKAPPVEASPPAIP